MSFLAQVEKGTKSRPYYVIVYGSDGVGKTTFAADAPKPIFIASESGTDRLNVARFPTPKSFSEIGQMVDELIADASGYETLALDSLDWAEPLCWAEVVNEAKKPDINSIEDFGYGKGYVKATDKWLTLIHKLNQLREKMNIVLIAHSKMKTFQDPQMNAGYDRYELKLHSQAAALFRESVDAVLFANFEVFTKKDGHKVRAYGEGSRVLFTERRPSFDAKNRFGLPFQLPLSWEEFDLAAKVGEPDSEQAITDRITGLVSEIKDAALKKKVEDTVKGATGNVKKLAQIEDRLKMRLGEK